MATPPGTCYGQTDVDVAETFAEEAAAVRAALEGRRFDAVYSSPLRRCMKLAAACGYAEPRVDDRLMELNFGSWEGMRWDEIRDPKLQDWCRHWLGTKAGGGECFLDQYRRIANFIDEAAERGEENVLVFAHGGSIRAALVHADKDSFRHVFDKLVDYGSLTEIEM